MSFSDVKIQAEYLKKILRDTADKELFLPLIVEEPTGEPDEAYFLRLITWCYVFLNEAGFVPVKYLKRLLKSFNPSLSQEIDTIYHNLINLRTYCSHGMNPECKADNHKIKQATVWLLTYGSEPRDWSLCCQKASADMVVLLKGFSQAWSHATFNEEDREMAVKTLLEEVDGRWPAYIFDNFIEEAARELHIDSLNIKEFRTAQLNEWQKIPPLFLNRDSAERALKARIFNELKIFVKTAN